MYCPTCPLFKIFDIIDNILIRYSIDSEFWRISFSFWQGVTWLCLKTQEWKQIRRQQHSGPMYTLQKHKHQWDSQELWQNLWMGSFARGSFKGISKGPMVYMTATCCSEVCWFGVKTSSCFLCSAKRFGDGLVVKLNEGIVYKISPWWYSK